MLIILRRVNNLNSQAMFGQADESYFGNSIFAHISNLMRVQQVKIFHSQFHGNAEEIVITAMSYTSDERHLAKAIKEAVFLRGELELVSINFRSNDFQYSM